MLHTPAINSYPLPVRLCLRPLNSQVGIAHQCLPNVVEAVIHVIFLVLQQRVVRLHSVVVIHACLQREQKCSNVVEAVQLVEDGDVVDFALALPSSLAGRERVVFRVRDEDETIPGWGEVIAPCLVCFRCRARGEERALKLDELLGNWEQVSLEMARHERVVLLSGANDNRFVVLRSLTTPLNENSVYAHAIASSTLTARSHRRNLRIDACSARVSSFCSYWDGFSACSLLSL